MSDGNVNCPKCEGEFIYNTELDIFYKCPKCHGKWDGHFPIKLTYELEE